MKSCSCLFFLLTLFSGTFNIQAQKEVLNFPIGYKSTFYDGKESLAISNPDTERLVLFIEDEENSKAVLLDKEFLVIDELTIKSLERTFKNFIGYQINNDETFSVFFTNKKNKKFGVLVLDFNKGEAVQKKLEFKLSEESYVEGVSHKNKFYLISVTKSGSDVHFYSFNGLGLNIEKKTVDFSFLNGKAENGFPKTASSYLGSSFIKVDANSPNAVEVTSNPNKFYIANNDFVFSFDDKKDKTRAAVVSPNNDFSFVLNEYDKPVVKSAGLMNHNSYVYKNKIYQVCSTPKELTFTIRDFNSKDLLKELHVKKEEEITFKNTPIIQEGTSFGNNTRHLETTSQFLRKSSRGDIGISVYLDEGKYKITIGSKIEKPSGSGFGPMGGFGGSPIASFGAVSMTFNPTFFAYGNYSSTKSTYIDCVFDEGFNHLKGEVPVTTFDRIKKFEDEFVKKKSKEVKDKDLSNSDLSDYGMGGDFGNDYTGDKNKPKLKNVFYHNEKLYFGFIGYQDKNFHLIEF